MQFNTGTPNLVGQARFYASDEDGYQLWSAQEVKDAVNLAYLEYRDKGRRQHTGMGEKLTYLNSTADNPVQATLPTDFIEVINVYIDLEGKNLSTDSTATHNWLSPSDPTRAGRLYDQGILTETLNYWIRDTSLIVVAPPTVGGTNSIQLEYGAETDRLSNDSDTPTGIPEPFHPLIAFKAAYYLKLSKDMPIGDLSFTIRDHESRYLASIGEQQGGVEDRAVISGRKGFSYPYKTGRFKRR